MPPIVSIKQGHIKGVTDQNLDGETFYKFLGIPYAKPPVGSLRFKAPEPPQPWHGIRDCTKEGNKSLAPGRNSTDEILGSEDCLYLNVYSRQLPKREITPKPVMVYIHGGGFIIGSGSQEWFGAHFLLTEDIVLVTINYRLGLLGFLSSDDLSLNVPGNAALKDQRCALKWVQENISSFNGDPNNVTIFGVSAGAASVQFQVLSSSAKGLFHKAIAQSGSVLNPWAWGSKNAIQVAQYLGANVSNDREALDVLMNTPADELVKASLKIPDGVIDGSRRRPFCPVIEKPNPTAFLTENPLDLLKSGRFNQVPIIQGCVSNEGLVYEFGYLGGFFPIEDESMVPWTLNHKKNSDQYRHVIDKVEDFYFKEGKNKSAIYKFVGDINFVQGVVESTKLIVKSSSKPLYFYMFSHEVQLSDSIKVLVGINAEETKGVSHAGDQMVLFQSSFNDALGVNMTEKENKQAAKQFVKLWTNFAKTGKPDPDWDPVTDPENLKYFDIDRKCQLKLNPLNDRLLFWENIFENASSRDVDF